MKVRMLSIFSILFILIGASMLSSCQTEVIDGSEKAPETSFAGNVPSQGEAVYLAEMSFEQILSLSDLLVAAKITGIEENVPMEGADRYRIAIERDLGGNFPDKELTFDASRSDKGFEDGTLPLFEKDQVYLLPLLCDTFGGVSVFTPVVPSVRINLSNGTSEVFGEPIPIPDNRTIEDYASERFRLETHKSFEKKTYKSDLDEMIAESAFICTFKAESVSEGLYFDSGRFSLLEVLKGDETKLNRFGETDLFAISVAPGSVTAGEEYVIGFNPVTDGSAAYTTPTVHSVLPINDELIAKIRESLK